ncbi:MAG: hypothetical protein CHACPFDD_00115 [Phycisphaerae bacterium]|nr:hypothetical protein [Phycisphaerae bacterium]
MIGTHAVAVRTFLAFRYRTGWRRGVFAYHIGPAPYSTSSGDATPNSGVTMVEERL